MISSIRVNGSTECIVFEGYSDYFASRGAALLYLPPYSPDLNPIEKMWSKVKEILRERGSTTTEALFEAIRAAFERITPENAKGRFESCEYFHL
jgi:transposase